MPVENIPLPAPVAPVNPDFLASHQQMSAAMVAAAAAATRQSVAAEAMAAVGEGGRQERFTRILAACIEGRVATNVEGFLTFTRELCDGIDREFPA